MPIGHITSTQRPPIIPFGMVTIMEGDPGVGKSYLAMHIAAQVSIGGSLPGVERLKRGQVLYCSAEDDPAYTIRPRIDVMGGDPERIRFQARYSPFDDEGLSLLRREVRSFHPDLIVIDPLYAYVPSGTDMYKPNEIRALLADIGEIAASVGAAVLVIRHLTKAKREKAIYQGVGSIDVIAAARSAVLVAVHPEDDRLKVIAHVKYNLSPRGDSWLYELATNRSGALPVLAWRGKSNLTADDLLNPSHDGPSALEVATEFLREELKKGSKLATEMYAKANSRGIAKRNLDRARKQIKVRAIKTAKDWRWELSKDDCSRLPLLRCASLAFLATLPGRQLPCRHELAILLRSAPRRNRAQTAPGRLGDLALGPPLWFFV